jgi:hypothetical protein
MQSVPPTTDVVSSNLDQGFSTHDNYYGCWLVGWFDGVQCHFQQYFSYIVAVSFIGDYMR